MRDGAAIVSKLGGHRTSKGWMFRCPCHSDSTPSCSLRDDDGLVTCFANCPRDQVGQALDALGFPDDGTRTKVDPKHRQLMIEGKIRGAQELWIESSFNEQTVIQYFERRCIFLPKIPITIRCYSLNGIMACVQQLDGLVTAVLCKEPYKKGITHGWKGSGAVRLGQPTNGELGLAEGLETALSATQLTGKPCWATLGADQLPKVAIPDGVRKVVIFADNDSNGVGQREAANAVAA
jgi:putative DNA primase/helicase